MVWDSDVSLGTHNHSLTPQKELNASKQYLEELTSHTVKKEGLSLHIRVDVLIFKRSVSHDHSPVITFRISNKEFISLISINSGYSSNDKSSWNILFHILIYLYFKYRGVRNRRQSNFILAKFNNDGERKNQGLQAIYMF